MEGTSGYATTSHERLGVVEDDGLSRRGGPVRGVELQPGAPLPLSMQGAACETTAMPNAHLATQGGATRKFAVWGPYAFKGNLETLQVLTTPNRDAIRSWIDRAHVAWTFRCNPDSSALPDGVHLAVVSPDADSDAMASVESPLDVTLQVDPRAIGTNCTIAVTIVVSDATGEFRSEEHTSELQSH